MKKNFLSGFYVFLAGAALLLCCAFPVSAQAYAKESRLLIFL